MTQLSSSGGTTTFYYSNDTYPSSAYYQQKVESRPDRTGVMYIPYPFQSKADEPIIVYGNIKGSADSATSVSMALKIGGIWIDIRILLLFNM